LVWLATPPASSVIEVVEVAADARSAQALNWLNAEMSKYLSRVVLERLVEDRHHVVLGEVGELAGIRHGISRLSHGERALRHREARLRHRVGLGEIAALRRHVAVDVPKILVTPVQAFV
jgi:hypothetical protein